MNRFFGVLVSTMFYFSSVVLTQADEVRDFLLNQLNATDFNTISDTFVDGYQSFVISEKDLFFETDPKSRVFKKMWEIYLESLLDSVHGYPIPFFEPAEFWEFFK